MTDVEERRKSKNLSQEEIAFRLGVSRQYYNEIENGKRSPSVKLAKRIGKLLDLEWIIFFTP